MTAALKQPMSLKLYRALSRAAEPVANIALRQRARRGKEDPARIGERRGAPGRDRADGPLIWIHGASVGESLSVIPLVKRLHTLRPGLQTLVTTGTVTSAALLEDRLPDGAFHQYIPLDHPDYVNRFLDHWRPDAALFVESEFWPNLILSTRERTPFMALVNGRISPRSFEDWKRQPNWIRYILSAFDLIIAQDYQNADRLATLAGRAVEMFGNLKIAAPALPTDATAQAVLKEAIGARPVWLAASTHPGEEELAIAAHQQLSDGLNGLLTIIAPRHPARGAEIAELAEENGLSVARRARSEPITDKTDIYIADTLGELGLFYRLSPIAFVGGGVTPKGGHNPLEPARLGVAVLHGPHVFNFTDTYADLRKASGAALVRNDRELAAAIRRLHADPKTRSAMAQAAKQAAEENAEKTLNDICDALLEKLPASLGVA